jgi:serine/threonine protein kinase
VHRDLKPKNIFLDFSGDIKIGAQHLFKLLVHEALSY